MSFYMPPEIIWLKYGVKLIKLTENNYWLQFLLTIIWCMEKKFRNSTEHIRQNNIKYIHNAYSDVATMETLLS